MLNFLLIQNDCEWQVLGSKFGVDQFNELFIENIEKNKSIILLSNILNLKSIVIISKAFNIKTWKYTNIKYVLYKI